jgi:hypothetical protein
MTLYPTPTDLYWLAVSLTGIGLNVALVYMAVRSVLYARQEGGVLTSQAVFLLVRISLRATTHLVNLALGLIGLFTPPPPTSPSGPTLQGIAILVGLFAVQHLLVADAVVDLFSRHLIMRRLMREDKPA